MIPVVAPNYPQFLNWLRHSKHSPREYRFVSREDQLQGTTEIIVLDGGSPNQQITQIVRERRAAGEIVREEFSK